MNDLQRYGLTPIQAKIYYNLLRFGRTSATHLASEMGIHRSEVYRVLRELAKKGIVTELDAARPIEYEPTPPKEALNVLLQQQREELECMKDRLPKLVHWLSMNAAVKECRASVLLIDDDATIRAGVSRALKSEGFDVDVASNGSEALEKSRRKSYTIALVDVRLPDMNGTRLLSTLRAENPGIKQVVLTKYPSVEDAARAIDEGAVAYLLKPFEIKELLEKIRKIMKP